MSIWLFLPLRLTVPDSGNASEPIFNVPLSGPLSWPIDDRLVARICDFA